MQDVTKDFAVDELSSAIRSHIVLSTTAQPSESAKTEQKAAPPQKAAVAAKEAAAPKTADADQPYSRWSLKDESSIEYGSLGKTEGKGIQEQGEGYYITTAINYTNGPAHMGHAYEAATSDVIARFQRLKGNQPAYFVTGSDEHGQKIADTAAADGGKDPIEICNKVRGSTRIKREKEIISSFFG
jgi:methionyl-tRNA synthetase